MATAQASSAPKRDWLDRNSQDSSFRVIEIDFRSDPRWLEFLSNHRDALIYHHPGWLAALEAEYGRKCIALACEDPDRNLLGILPLLPTRGIPFRLFRNRIGRRLSSLPRTPLAGPLAIDDRAMTAMLHAAIKRVQAAPNTQLELKTTEPELHKLVPELKCVPWRDTFVRGTPTNETPSRDLVGPQTREPRSCTSCDTCRILTFGNARGNHQVRWAVNKAAKQGLSLRGARDEKELRSWYSLYLQVMRRNAVPPRPFRFFRQLWKELRAGGEMELVIVERANPPDERPLDGSAPVSAADGSYHSSETEAGSILLQYGHTVFWAFTGSQQRRGSQHATDLTLWNCIHGACKLGYDYFDLGEVAENHPELSQFKTKWGTERRPMFRYYYSASGAASEPSDDSGSSRTMEIAFAIWRRLPLAVTAVLGDWIFSFL